MAMATLASRSRRSNGTVESRTSTASGAVTVTAQSRVEDHGVVVTPVDGDRPFGHPCDDATTRAAINPLRANKVSRPYGWGRKSPVRRLFGQ